MNQDRRYYKLSGSVFLQPLLSNVVVSLGIHWLFQGVLYMDRTERLFKLALDGIIAIAITIPLVVYTRISFLYALFISLIIAHTSNFLLNAQICVVLKHFGLIKHSRAEFEGYMEQIARRVRVEPAIIYAAVYGSLVRGEWNPSSDLDIRLVRRLGYRNGLRACWFVLGERTRALLAGFPLDIYVLDNESSLALMRSDEQPSELGRGIL